MGSSLARVKSRVSAFLVGVLLLVGWLALTYVRNRADSTAARDARLAEALRDYQSGRFNEAFDALREAKKLGATPIETDRLEGLLLATAGDSAAAEPILMTVLERAQGEDLEVAEKLARIFLSGYKFPLAKIVLERWIKVAPRDAKPHLWLTEIDRRTEVSPDVTLEHFRAALERDPGLSAARLGLAETLYAAKRSEEAAREFDEYLKADPNDAKARVGAAQVSRDLGDFAALERHLDVALRVSPADPVALKLKGILDLRRDSLETALSALEKSAGLDPNDVETLHHRAIVLARLGRTSEAGEARAIVEKLRKDQAELLDIQHRLLGAPDDPELRSQVARWMFDHGRLDEAAKWAGLVLERSRNDPGMNRLMAEFHEKRGEPGLANYYRLRAGN